MADAKDVKSAKVIVAQPHQIEHLARIDEIIKTNHGYIDVSKMGLGKTYIVGAVAQKYGFPLLVIHPPGEPVKDVWMKMINEYKIPFYAVISYNDLAGTEKSQPKSGLLTRTDTVHEGKTGRQTTITQFYATKLLSTIIESGCLLVFDEFHLIKNVGAARSKAAKVVLHTLLCSKSSLSRYALLSGTPFDKEDTATSLLKSLGFINHDKLYNEIRGEFKLLGLADLIDVSNKLDPDATADTLDEFGGLDGIDKGNAREIVFRLFLNVIAPTLISSAEDIAREKDPYPTDIKNGFYNMDAKATEELKKGIEVLSKSVRYEDNKSGEIIDTGGLGRALQMIDTAKVPLYVRLGKMALGTKPGSKVVFALGHDAAIDGVIAGLKDYNPLVIRGKIPMKQRVGIIKAFNEDPNSRVMVGNIKTMGTGINLHDTVGNSPRIMFISPTYDMLTLVQATGRIDRVGKKSQPMVRIVYGKEGATEVNILNSLVKKSDVLSDVISVASGTNRPRDLPNSYVQFVEP